MHFRPTSPGLRGSAWLLPDFLKLLLLDSLHAEIAEKMGKNGDLWQCLDCLWTTKYKTRLWEHIEAKHVKSQGYMCPFCSKFCSSKNAYHQHKSKFHKGC